MIFASSAPGFHAYRPVLGLVFAGQHAFYTFGDLVDELYLNMVMEYVPETVYCVMKRFGLPDLHFAWPPQPRKAQKIRRWWLRSGAFSSSRCSRTRGSSRRSCCGAFERSVTHEIRCTRQLLWMSCSVKKCY